MRNTCFSSGRLEFWRAIGTSVTWPPIKILHFALQTDFPRQTLCPCYCMSLLQGEHTLCGLSRKNTEACTRTPTDPASPLFPSLIHPAVYLCHVTINLSCMTLCLVLWILLQTHWMYGWSWDCQNKCIGSDNTTGIICSHMYIYIYPH